jgi:pimeloyl-ACP methyl ester carboxylesterase
MASPSRLPGPDTLEATDVSSITTDQGSLHYEVFGRGHPVILLHGYQGSWGLWQATMEVLGATYRTYAVDFWGFGESGARRSSYAVDDFVSLVDQFMSQMGIAHAPLVGHSMGGTVCLLVAARHPQRVEKAVAISAPIVGSSLRFFPKVFGFRPVGWLTYHNLWLYRWFYRILAPVYSRDPEWARMMDRDVSHTTLEAFFASIGSLRTADLRPVLPGIRMPVFGMYGGRDNVVDPRQEQLLRNGTSRRRTHVFPASGHFIMLDEPASFTEHLKAFLDEPASN